MGQHTWFFKDKEIYSKINKLYNKLDAHESNEILLYDIEISEIYDEIYKLRKQNSTDYHDLFRTNKYEPNGEYTLDVICSKEQCLDWINNPENKVHFKYSIFDTEEQEKQNKEFAIKKLNEFWDKYPNGVIYFG